MISRPFFLLLILLLPLVNAQELKAPPASDLVNASPESQGYSSKRLDALRAWLHTGPTTAMMVLANGEVIFVYGDVTHVSKIASVRKSTVSMLMGKYALAGKINTSKTVEE